MTRPDLHHELDQRLRADGARWREATTMEPDTQSSPAYLYDLHDVRHSRPSRLKGRLAIAASVAAVLAIAIGVSVAATSKTGPNHPPAGQPTGPQPTISRGSGYGSVLPGTHACDASEFRLIAVSHHTTQTGIIITATLKDTGTTACSMPGHGPLARLLNAAGNLLAQGSDTLLDGRPPIVVPPGAQVDVQALWFSTCHLDTPATQLQFRLQGPRTGPPASTADRYVTVSLLDIPTPGCSTQEQRDATNVAGMALRAR